MRLFVAVGLEAPLIAHIAARVDAVKQALSGTPHGVRWVAPETMHLTLAFLGERDPATLPVLSDALARAAKRVSGPFRLGLRGAGAFGSARRPRVLWAGIAGDRGALAALHREVTTALSTAVGYTVEHDFAPHLTLARSKAPGGDPLLAAAREALFEEPFGETWVRSVDLHESQLSPGGPTYLLKATHALGSDSPSRSSP